MSRNALIAMCRDLPHATEDIKWGDHQVFSIGGKMFACFPKRGAMFSFKASPEAFAMLTREPGIKPAPYAARFHWVHVDSVGCLPVSAARDLLREAYDLVFEKLPVGKRRSLQGAPMGTMKATVVTKSRTRTPARPRFRGRRSTGGSSRSPRT